MKIIQIISNLGNGGAEKFVVELSNQLSNNNTVILCTFKPIEEWMFFSKLLVNKVKLIPLHKKTGFDFRIYKQLFILFKTEKPNVVHFHLDATIKYILPLITLFPKIKFIYTIHSNLNSDKIKLFKKLNKIKWLSEKVKYICISESIYNEFKKEFPEFNFVLIENGIAKLQTSEKFPEVENEIRKFVINNKTKKFVIIGNYSKPKNFSLIVNAFNKLYQIESNAILLIIGNDSSLDKSEWKRIESQKSPNTYMLGLKSNVSDYLFLSDAYCTCSIYEGLPISIIEAYSLGKPVLSTPAGGIPSILENRINGLLTPDFSVDSYCKMINEFTHFTNIELEIIKNNNINYFKNNFTIEKTANKYIANYIN